MKKLTFNYLKKLRGNNENVTLTLVFTLKWQGLKNHCNGHNRFAIDVKYSQAEC